MKFIGITGGVGAGKSEILHWIEKEYQARILLADELAHELMLPGMSCYKEICRHLGGEDIFAADGSFDAQKLSAVLFSDAKARRTVNGIVHPAVKREVLRQVELERQKGERNYFILEAALLIEEGYDAVCDELWYIDAEEQCRRRRLKESRGYSDEKIDHIVSSQLSRETYLERCQVVIENNGTLAETFRQIREAL